MEKEGIQSFPVVSVSVNNYQWISGTLFYQIRTRPIFHLKTMSKTKSSFYKMRRTMARKEAKAPLERGLPFYKGLLSVAVVEER